MKYLFFFLILLNYSSYGQGVGVPCCGTRPQDTAVIGRSLRVDSNIKFLKYKNKDTTKVATFDSLGNLILKTVISGSSGIIPVIKGGTGITSYTIGDMIYAGGIDSFAKVSIGSTGQVWAVNGSGVPAWLSLTVAGTVSNVDGSLTIAPISGAVVASLNTANANTWPGKQTFSTAPAFTTATNNGGILYDNSTGTLQQTAAGSSTQVLHGGTNPAFSAVALGTDVSGTLQAAQFPALTGDVITSAGNLATTYNNVVPANKGGAGTINGLLKANGSGTVSQATSGTDYLTPTGSGSALTGIVTSLASSAGSITVSSATGAVNVELNSAHSFTNTGTWAWSQTALGTTITPVISLINPTAATSGVPVQNTPVMYFNSQARSVTSGSETSEWWIVGTPINETGDILGQLSFFASVNGGAKITAFSILSNGNYTSSGIGQFGNIEIAGFNGLSNPNIISSIGTLGLQLQTFQGNIFLQCPGGTTQGITSIRPRANFNQQFTAGLQVFSPISESSVDSFTSIQITNVETSLGSGRQLLIDFNAGTLGTIEVMNITNKGIFGYYNGVKTVGIGVPAIYGMGNVTAQTTATTVATYTPASTGTFNISASANITAITADSMQVQCTYTDENSTPQTLVLPPPASIFTNKLGVTGATSYPTFTIRALGGTAVTISATLPTSSGTITYNAYGRIWQL